MILFSFPEQAELARSMGSEHGAWQWRHFPDGESYVRVLTDVRDKEAAILCSLDQPDTKALPLIFLARTLKEMGAAKVALIAPYLGYMRQDKRFHEGEAVTANIFASVLSSHIDALITIDPHLHRHRRMEEIYACECKVASAAPLMADWIKRTVMKPILIGPDLESEQWVREVAAGASAPYIVLQKIRHGDRDVEIVLPDIARYRDRTPVLVDDIISTASTMIRAIELIKARGFAEIVCLATHGLFVEGAYGRLRKAGATRIVTANTVPHPSNALNVAKILTAQIS
jgi:ribose-phosphate pyrophosphokinase